MTDTAPRVLVVPASQSPVSSTRTVLLETARRLEHYGCPIDLFDFHATPLPLLDPEVHFKASWYPAIQARVQAADVLLLGTPDYHGCMSGTLKNFLDHFWKEFAGKLFASIVASQDRGLTVTDQIRTAARQCYAWSIPYAVVFNDRDDLTDGAVPSGPLAARLDMLARDLHVYGQLLASARRADLASSDPGFLARYRK